MSADLQDRVAELEEYTRRVIPARDGTDGWINYIQSCLREERKFSHEVVAHALAMMRNEILDTAKAAIEAALVRRVKGTHNPQSEYSANDIVAKDGGTFIAQRDNPGPCPGDGWQLMAKQGARGVAGPRGERGSPGKTIDSWVVNRGTYVVTPRFNDGSLGPPLELRELFEPSQQDDAAV
jgi:hypothetical protein